MADRFTIGEVARRTGVPVKTIRFYESEWVIAAPSRTDSGYRLYSATDVRRLRLARRARLLGLALPEVRTLVDQAFRSECIDFGQQQTSPDHGGSPSHMILVANPSHAVGVRVPPPPKRRPAFKRALR
jgi:DNA-binding transcriptional MerR regulator